MRPLIRPGSRHQRVFPLSSVEVRAGEGDQPAHIVGHAAVYSRWSVDLGGFKERVMPGAFAKSLGVSDVRALFNHDPNYILGRTKPGTLTLSDETKGLHFDATPPDTQTIRDLVLAPIARGDVDQCSFSFAVRGTEAWDREPTATDGAAWRAPKKDGGLWERDLIDLELFDVSPVTFPAYPQTDVAVRALLSETGIDLDALTAVFARTQRGLPILDNDVDLLESSIAVLRTLLPEANGEEPSGVNPEDGSHSELPTSTAPTRAQLIRELEHRIRIDQSVTLH